LSTRNDGFDGAHPLKKRVWLTETLVTCMR